MRFSVSRHRRTQSLPSPARGEENPLSVKSQPSKSNPTARNRSAVWPVRTSRPTRAVDLKSNSPHRPKHFGRSDLNSPRSDLTDAPQPSIPNPTLITSPKDPPSGNPSEPTTPEDPFGALSEDDTYPRSPAKCPFEASVETLSGPSFGECRVSRQPPWKPSL